MKRVRSPKERPTTTAAKRVRARPENLLKMSQLAQKSGVPAATIKHYVNEGLLPEPRRTSRNMAYYDPAVIPLVQRIKELQRTRFLPLRVIKELLDDATLGSPDEIVGAAIARVLHDAAPGESRTRRELIASGLPSDELDYFERLGIVNPEAGRSRATDRFRGDDLEVLRLLGAARRAGLGPDMLPLHVLGDYAAALSQLVRAELRVFREGVLPRAGRDLPALTEAATVLSERLVVLMRRRLLLPTLRQLVDEESTRRGAPRK